MNSGHSVHSNSRKRGRNEAQTYDALFDATWEVWEAFAFYGVPPNAALSEAAGKERPNEKPA